MTAENAALVHSLHLKHRPYREIAQLTGCSITSVARVLKGAGSYRSVKKKSKYQDIFGDDGYRTVVPYRCPTCRGMVNVVPCRLCKVRGGA